MMPNTIHYIWLGKNKKPETFSECLESWKKFFPDWKIIEWNESNLNINEIRYCREAYQEKKYAFVSDYFRFLILYKYCGLYFDVDVKVLKSFTNIIEKNEVFSGFEDKKNINPGLVLYSKNKGEILFKEMLDSYEKENFILKDETLNLKTVVTRFTELLQKYGLKSNNTKQKIKNMTIFPMEYFCPMNYITREINITDNTYAIHLYNASWLSLEEKKEQKIYRDYYNKYSKQKINNNIVKIMSRIIAIYKVYGVKTVYIRMVKKMKKFFVGK